MTVTSDGSQDSPSAEAKALQARTTELWKGHDAGHSATAMTHFCNEYLTWLKDHPGQLTALNQALDKDRHALIGITGSYLNVARIVQNTDNAPLIDLLACKFENGTVTGTSANRLQLPELPGRPKGP